MGEVDLGTVADVAGWSKEGAADVAKDRETKALKTQLEDMQAQLVAVGLDSRTEEDKLADSAWDALEAMDDDEFEKARGNIETQAMMSEKAVA